MFPCLYTRNSIKKDRRKVQNAENIKRKIIERIKRLFPF